MRAKAIVLTLILAALAANAFAAEGLTWWSNPWTESFRSASTGSLLEDDLDVMLDPAGLPTLQGYRLYTNLSNLATAGKDDYVFNNGSNNYYLLGGSGKVMGYGYAGMLFDRRAESYRDTTLTNSSVYSDNDANGTYDQKTVTDAMNSDYSKNAWTDLWLGYGRNFGAGRLGALVYRQAGTNNTMPTGLNTISHIVATDLVTGNVTSDANTEKSFNSLTVRSVTGGAVSYWMPMGDKIDLGLAGGVNIRLATEYDTMTYSLTSTDPSAAGTNGTTIDSTGYVDIIPTDNVGLELNVRGAAIYKWSDNVKTRTDLVFSTLSGERTDGYHNSEYNSLTANQLPTGVQSTNINRTYTSDPITQDNHRMSLSLLTKTTAKLGEKVEMAMGLGFGTSTRDYSTKYTQEYNQTTVYNDGDAATMPDQTIIVNGTVDYQCVYTESNFGISAPVGLEFNITKPFVFRLGATPTYNTMNSTKDSLYEYTPNKTITIDAWGDTTQTIPATVDGNWGRCTVRNESNILVNYAYGAGWKISENLQIDLMGFTDIYTMRYWQLSAILKF